MCVYIYIYLTINFMNFGSRGIEGEEQVIGAPSDEFSGVVIVSDTPKLVTIFDDTPAQHGD